MTFGEMDELEKSVNDVRICALIVKESLDNLDLAHSCLAYMTTDVLETVREMFSALVDIRKDMLAAHQIKEG